MNSPSTNPLLKFAALFSFFVLITGLVLFKAGLFPTVMGANLQGASDGEYYEYEMESDTSKPNGKQKNKKRKPVDRSNTFSGSKSGAVFIPENIKRDTNLDDDDLIIVPSTKSARIFTPNEVKSTKTKEQEQAEEDEKLNRKLDSLAKELNKEQKKQEKK